MCGRYQFTAEQSAEILRIIQEVSRRYGDDSWTPGEIRPTNAAPVLVSEERSIVPALFTWGFPMPDAPGAGEGAGQALAGGCRRGP